MTRTPPTQSGSKSQPIRVLVVGEPQLRRIGLRLLLEQQVGTKLIGAVGIAELEASLAETAPHVLLVKMDTPGILAACGELAKRNHGPRLLAISNHCEADAITATLAEGFAGYVLSSASVSQLVDAITAVHAGQMYLSPGAVEAAVATQPPATDQPDHSSLSKRECEVLTLLAEGCPTKQIAATLALSTKTIETHRLRIMRKLKLFSVAELTKYAIRHGLTHI